MTKSSTVFRVGTRPSKLARIQTASAVQELQRLVPDARFDVTTVSSPGDRDRKTDLRTSPEDFFTRDLDDALLDSRIDCAIHSAKDLPATVPEDIDWCWLPLAEDPRDAMILPAAKNVADLPQPPRIGVSSDRRADWAEQRFPGADLQPIRGNIEQRLEKLDSGEYDMIVMAAAALHRLGYTQRITLYIPLHELRVPDGQGKLAITFRNDASFFRRLRRLFVKPVVFAGAGPGESGLCTQAGIQALQHCDIALYDSLLDPDLLRELPPHAQAVDVGKRCGKAAHRQLEITRMIADYARRGLKVVRLKGGDPGMFGRLAEETDLLTNLQLPFRVIPGVSSLNAATSETGILLTQRGVSRGFCALTPRQQGGGLASVDARARSELPMAFFMSVKAVSDIRQQLLDDGTQPDTPAAVVFNAGMPQQCIHRDTLQDIDRTLPDAQSGCPGILVVGEAARTVFPEHNGALARRRICLTCSDSLQAPAARAVSDYDGVPVNHQLISTTLDDAAADVLNNAGDYDWLVLTSPSAVRCMMSCMKEQGQDLRKLPGILVSGPGTERKLQAYGIFADAVPQQRFGGEGVEEQARTVIGNGSRVLRLRSDKAGTALADRLRNLGADVNDVVLYRTVCRQMPEPPACDAVFFASSSAVTAWQQNYGVAQLEDKDVVAIGSPTARALEKYGVTSVVVGDEATAADAIRTYAEQCVKKELMAS